MKFHGLQAKEKKNALVYLVHFFLYPMNKLALFSMLNSLGDGNSMFGSYYYLTKVESKGGSNKVSSLSSSLLIRRAFLC